MTSLKAVLTLVIAALFSLTTYSQSDTLRQKDPATGKPIGYWIHYGKDDLSKGYPADGKMREGKYDQQGRRQGRWIFYYKDGKTPRTEGYFKDNRPNGDYTKRHPNGKISEKGTFTSDKKNVGSLKKWNDQGILIEERTLNQDGKTDGTFKLYYDDGTLQLEGERKNGEPVGTETLYYPNSNKKKVTTFGPGGEPKTETFDRVDPEKSDSDSGSSKPAPDGCKGKTNDGPVKQNGYNKIYNDDLELWMDGEFKNCRLWEGKLYKYDSDGILLKIEVWKAGKYHSDGVLR